MAKNLDDASLKILEFLKEYRHVEYRLTDIAEYAGLDHLQKVSHRLTQLEKNGYIKKNYEDGTYEVFDEPRKEIIYLPLYGSALCGNKGAAVLEERPQASIPVSTRILNISNPDDYFLVRAEGDSMLPYIKPGDIVLVKASNACIDGEKLLVSHNGVPKIKKMMKYDDTNVLVSFNREVEKVKLTPVDQVKIVGTVKTVISNSV